MGLRLTPSMRVAGTRAAIAGFLALGLASLWMGRRAAVLSPRRLEVVPLDTAPVDSERVALALGRTIRCQTISRSRDDPPAAEAFEALHAELRALFPRVHASLDRERVGDWSLLYTWPGSAPELAPIVLVAHQDVVPVDPGTEDAWDQPPFSGAVLAGEVWGRGALDDKGSLVASLAAVEDLLAEGFVPRRPVLLAFGHDEEIEGEAGARFVAAELAARGVHAALVLDEGGAISDVSFRASARLRWSGWRRRGR